MSGNLIELVGLERLGAEPDEAAALLGEELSNIAELQCWKLGLWVKRSHTLATVVSYRKLRCWIPAIEQAILGCTDLQQLAQLQAALEKDFEKRADAYPEETPKQLRQLIAQQQAQLEDEFAPLWKAEILTSGCSSMIKRCKTRVELDWVRQMIREQNIYLKLHPHLRDYLHATLNQQGHYLRKYGAAS